MINLNNINQILKPVESNVLLKIFLITISAMFLETLSIALLIPILNILLDPTKIDYYLKLLSLEDKFDLSMYNQIVIFCLISIFLVFLIKSISLIKLNFSQNKIIYRVKAKLSSILLKKYLGEKYSFHLKNNSTKLIQNTLNEVNRFIGEHLIPTATFLTESFVCAGLMIVLLFVEPVGAFFTILLLIVLLYLVTRLTKNIAVEYGKIRQINETVSLKNLTQALTGIREVKILNKESKFNEFFDKANFKASDSIRDYNNFVVIPRIVIELIGVTAVLFLIFFLIISGKQISEIITILSIFGVAAFRFLPSFNRIIIALQSIKYSIPSTNVVNKEINKKFEKDKINNIKKIIFESDLTLNEINFKYENTDEKILSNLNLNIKKNSIIGIFGESGSGKSTLVDIVSGLLKPSSGSIKIDNKIVESGDLLNANLIGYVSQNTFFIDDSVKKNIAFGLKDEEIDFVKLDKAIREAKLDNFVKNLESGLDTIIGERGIKISGGQRQRICIARALYFDSPILIFDEATNALDSKTELEILETIFSVKDKTMIIIAHHFTEWSNCDKIFKLENKTLVEKNDFKFN